MMKKYDFVLFENSRIVNHYKDLEILAQILQKANYTVAIADVFEEKMYCNDSSIEHIPVPENIFKPFGHKRNKNVIVGQIYRLQLNAYLKRVASFLRGKARAFYVGSLFLNTPIGWIDKLGEDTPVLFWGLRSVVFSAKMNLSLSGLLSRYLNRRLLPKANIKYIVSDALIRDEFISCGISADNIIIKPERLIPEQVSHIFISNGKLNLLSIGAIREKKKVEQCIDAIHNLNDSDLVYTIAGKSKNDVIEGKITQHSEGVNGIVRQNKRLTEEEYEDCFEHCDFLMICDAFMGSTSSSGTMNDALLRGIPVIAPDHNPFKYYVETYNIGILYEFGNIDSLCNAIQLAKNRGGGHYSYNIAIYQNLFIEDKVCLSIKRDLENILRITV